MVNYLAAMTMGVALAVSPTLGTAAAPAPVFQLSFAEPPAGKGYQGAGAAPGSFQIVQIGRAAQVSHHGSVAGRGGVVRFEAGLARSGGAGAAYLRRNHDSALDVGRRDFTVSAVVRLTGYRSGANIVQKGLFDDPQWKLQIDGGRPSCRVAGANRPQGEGTVAWSSRIPLDQWVTVTCQRAGGRLTIYVGGAKGGTVAAPADVSNNRPVTIGGKGAAGDPDQFLGYLDEVRLTIP